MANEYLNNKNFESIIQGFQFYKRHCARCRFVIEDYEETHNRRRTKYRDNSKKSILQEKIASYDEAHEVFNEFQQQLACAFYLLSQNIANWAKFSGIDIDDAIQEGVLICFEKIDRFDPRKGKAFNYMSTCILNHFRQLYRSARNYGELKRKYHGFLQDKFEKIVIRNGRERSSNFKNSLDNDFNSW